MRSLSLLALLVAGCATTTPSLAPPPVVSDAVVSGAVELDTELPSLATSPPTQTSDKPTWQQGQVMAQGWLGVSNMTSSDRSGSSVQPDDEDLDLGSVPVIGGGGMWKLGGKNVDIGLEGGLNFAFRTDGGFVAAGGSGATVAVSFNALLFDLYGGGFVSKYLGSKMRIYGAVGPLLQWASYDQSSSEDTYDGSGTGFGVGYYVRTGLEFVVSPSTMVGLGARWFESQVDLSGGLGDWNLSGVQLLFTVTQSF